MVTDDYARRVSDTLNVIINLDLNDSIIKAAAEKKKQMKPVSSSGQSYVEDSKDNGENDDNYASMSEEVMEEGGNHRQNHASNDHDKNKNSLKSGTGSKNEDTCNSKSASSINIPTKKSKNNGLKVDAISAKLAALRNGGVKK